MGRQLESEIMVVRQRVGDRVYVRARISPELLTDMKAKVGDSIYVAYRDGRVVVRKDKWGRLKIYNRENRRGVAGTFSIEPWGSLLGYDQIESGVPIRDYEAKRGELTFALPELKA